VLTSDSRPAKIKAGGRLIEQQEFGICHEGPSNLYPLPFALAESAEGPVGEARYVQLSE
jgi:hypothetical protein